VGKGIKGLLLFHCDARWNVIAGIGPFASLREAKQEAERFYAGMRSAWKRTGYSSTQVERQLARMGPKCSMCSKIWLDVEKMVEVKKGRFNLCETCIRELHKVISPE